MEATATGPHIIEQETREARACELRVQGWTLREIAAELGWQGPQGAYAAIKRAMDKTLSPPCEDLRRFLVARLDRIYKPLDAKVQANLNDPNKPISGRCLAAIDRLIKIQLTIAEISGLDLKARLVPAVEEELEPEAPAPLDRETQLRQIVERLQARADAEARAKAEAAQPMPEVTEVINHNGNGNHE